MEFWRGADPKKVGAWVISSPHIYMCWAYEACLAGIYVAQNLDRGITIIGYVIYERRNIEFD